MNHHHVNEVVGSGGSGQAVLCTIIGLPTTRRASSSRLPYRCSRLRPVVRFAKKRLCWNSFRTRISWTSGRVSSTAPPKDCIASSWTTLTDLGDYIKKRNGRFARRGADLLLVSFCGVGGWPWTGITG
ncbi:unnamed protein product [Ectocarpus sp. 12 AP-2014]